MYRFTLRPAWLLSHVLAASLVVLFVVLGLWQLRRHDERADRNAIIEARTEQPVAPVNELLAAGTDGDDLAYRNATAVGTYERDADLLVDNRSYDGLPGAWVVTPLRLDDGGVVAVIRGFQGFDSGVIDPPEPPADEVEVTGTVQAWTERSCGIRTDDAGDPVGAACLRRDAVEGVLGDDVAPVALQRASSAPDDADVLVPVPLPELDAGPHRSYAVQWFIFATIGLIGYPLILRRVAKDRSKGDPDRPAVDGPGDALDEELAALLADGGPDQARS